MSRFKVAMVLKIVLSFGATFAVAATAGPPLRAQIPDWLGPGHRVRIVATGRATPIVGVVSRLVGDSVALVSEGGLIRVAANTIGQLDVSRAVRRKTAAGAAAGLAAGALAGIVLGLDEGRRLDDAPAGRAIVAAIVFGALGAPVGALIGSMSRNDVWTRIYPVQQRPVSFGLTVPIRFHRRGAGS